MVVSLVTIKRTIVFVFLSGAMIAVLAPHTRSSTAQQLEDGGKASPIDWSVFLPEGEGKSLVMLSCTSCHDLTQVITQKKPESAWKTSVQKMVSLYKAPIDKEDVPALTEYLSRHFGKTNPIDRLPMDINTSSAASLARLPGVNADLAKAIVDNREKKGRFESVEDLSRVEGIDVSVLKRNRSYITTAH